MMCLIALSLFVQDAPGGLDYVEGVEAIGRADYAAAAASLSQAIEKESENAAYYAARGAALAFSEKLQDSAKDLQRALRLEPRNNSARLWMACVVAMNGQFGQDTQYFPFATQDKFESRLRDVTKDYGWPAWDQKEQGQATDAGRKKREAALREFPELAAMFASRLLSQPEAAKPLYAVAKKRYEEGKYAEALMSFDRVLATRPDDADVFFYHAYCLLHTGNFRRARLEFTRVLTLEPGWKSAYIGRAMCAEKMGDARRARSDLDAAAAIDPESVKNVSLALDKIPRSDQPNEALLDSIQSAEDARNVLRILDARRLRHDEWYQDQLRMLKDPVAIGDFLQSYATVIGERAEPRGPLLMMRAGNEEAELRRAEELLGQASTVTALAARASIHIRRGQWADAESRLREALGKEPGNIRVLELFAQVLEHAALAKRGKAADLRSTRTWEDASFIYTRYPSQAELDAADECDRQADKLFQMARAHLEKAAEQNTADGHYCKALLAWKDKKLDAARDALNESIRFKPEGRAYRLLVSVESASNRYIPALEAQCCYVNLYHSSCVPLLRAVWDCVRRTQWETGRKLLARAAQLDPSDPRVSAYRGILAEAEGKTDEAVRQYQVALWLSADETFSMGVRLALARVLIKAGRFEQADAALIVSAKIDRYSLPLEAYAAQLPDPAADPSVVPMNMNVAAILAWTRVGKGAARHGLKKYQDAIDIVLPTQQFEGLMVNGYGLDRVEKARLHGALWLAKSYLALGNFDEAGRYAALLPRKRHGSGPSLSPHAELEEEGSRLQAEIANRKAGLPADRPKGDKAKIKQQIVKDAGLTDEDIRLKAQAEQCIDEIYTDRIGERWKQDVKGSILNIVAGRDGAEAQVNRLKEFLKRRNDARSQQQLEAAEAQLAKYDKVIQALKKAAVEQGYPADELQR